MSKKKEAGPVKGFIIVHPEKGVFLGSGYRKGDRSKRVSQWSYDGGTGKAPIFLEENEKVLEEIGEGQAQYKEVESSTGFLSKEDATAYDIQWDNPETPTESSEEGEGVTTTKKKRRSRR